MSAAPARRHAIVTLELSSVRELASAQQQMYELVVSRVRMRPSSHENDEDDAIHASSPQADSSTNPARTLSFPVPLPPSADDESIVRPTALKDILSALRRGNNKLVVRRWKRGACWWNLQTDDGENDFSSRGNGIHSNAPNCSAWKMARAETDGYRLARRALRRRVFVAEVLYFSHDERRGMPFPPALRFRDAEDASSFEPWAVLSYFDRDAPRSETTSDEDFEIAPNPDFTFDSMLETPNSIEAYSKLRPCHHYPTTMTKLRREFGFDEPHPRHGRVPADECLEYVEMVLRDVVFPLQRYFFFFPSNPRQRRDESFGNDRFKEELSSLGWVSHAAPGMPLPFEFGIVPSEKRIYHDNDKTVPQPFQYLDMIATYRHALRGVSTSESYDAKDERTDSILQMLNRCVTALRDEWIDCQNRWSALPPVLCHLDLQPQNLAFHHDADEVDCGDTEHEAERCRVAAVMDWEEACYADPRFELMLLCRKVLADRSQADRVWHWYSERVQLWRDEFESRYEEEVDWDVGPIEPWLKLECVHSLCTLFLQLLDGRGGGRNPWETKTDLLGKMDRERQRLVRMRWSFCDLNIIL